LRFGLVCERSEKDGEETGGIVKSAHNLKSIRELTSVFCVRQEEVVEEKMGRAMGLCRRAPSNWERAPQ
jgi:hypothetical protein